MSEEKKKSKGVSESLVIIQSLLLMYFVLHIFYGVDYYISKNKEEIWGQEHWWLDHHIMPLAPHRLSLPKPN
jgi:hypothetical protein